MAKYKPEVVGHLATTIETVAWVIMVLYGLVGGLLGSVLGSMAGFGGLGGLIGAAVGFGLGWLMTLVFRAVAQVMLALVAIERNTSSDQGGTLDGLARTSSAKAPIEPAPEPESKPAPTTPPAHEKREVAPSATPYKTQAWSNAAVAIPQDDRRALEAYASRGARPTREVVDERLESAAMPFSIIEGYAKWASGGEPGDYTGFIESLAGSISVLPAANTKERLGELFVEATELESFQEVLSQRKGR